MSNDREQHHDVHCRPNRALAIRAAACMGSLSLLQKLGLFLVLLLHAYLLLTEAETDVTQPIKLPCQLCLRKLNRQTALFSLAHGLELSSWSAGIYRVNAVSLTISLSVVALGMPRRSRICDELGWDGKGATSRTVERRR